MDKREKQKRKENRIHRNAIRNPNSRIKRHLSGEKILDRPNWG